MEHQGNYVFMAACIIIIFVMIYSLYRTFKVTKNIDYETEEDMQLESTTENDNDLLDTKIVETEEEKKERLEKIKNSSTDTPYSNIGVNAETTYFLKHISSEYDLHKD